MSGPAPVAPGVMRLALRTPTLPPATTTNCWILGEDRVLLVDPAPIDADEQARLLQVARGLRVDALFLTHHHGDHVGAAGFLAEALGVQIWAHAETAARLDLPIRRQLDEGDAWQGWTVRHTPGHAPGHLCLLRDDGVAAVGDMVAAEGTILIDPIEGDLRAYLHHLARLKALGVRTLLPAHGPAIVDGPALIDQYIAHRNLRSQQILAALAAVEQADAEALAPRVYPELNPAFWPLAALQIQTHLQALTADGQAHTDDGLTFRRGT